MFKLENLRIVLVEPDHPGNIGGACRALKTMGLTDLRLIAPKRFPDPQAQWRAAGAQDVLEAARVHDHLEEAIDDCHCVVGTSTRSRTIPWPVVSARGLAERVLAMPADARVAILFGRETNGLHNEELQRCDLHLQIPANPDYPSLNLAMAVQVVCYELFAQAEQAPAIIADSDRPPATNAEVEAIIEHLSRAAVESGFVAADNPGQTLTRLRRLLRRADLDRTEVQMLHGLLRALGAPLR
ncbi:MAG: RNA methyltransferase [Pseudomonadota bacterium]